jgi:hypothetical protein
MRPAFGLRPQAPQPSRKQASQRVKALYGSSHAGAVVCQFRREEFLPISALVGKTRAKTRELAILAQGVVS